MKLFPDQERPLIGITCHVDEGGREDIFPNRALNYMDRTYPDVLIANGMLPILIPVNQDNEYIAAIINELDGLVCTGGGKIPEHILNRKEIPGLAETAPERYLFENKLFINALEKDLPILGMCRGMQTMSELLGGTMYYKITEDIPHSLEHNQTRLGIPLEEPFHEIEITADSHLKRVLKTGSVLVNSWHSQAIKRPGKGLKVVAITEDGVVEAVESENHTFVLLTQFHPEIMVKRDEMWNGIFGYFREQTLNYKSKRGKSR